MKEVNLLPAPLHLNTHDPNIGIRLQLMFDPEGLLRLSVVMAVGGEDWPPFFCDNAEEAHKQVRALFAMLDAYGPCSTMATVEETGRQWCWDDPDDERDDVEVSAGDKETNS